MCKSLCLEKPHFFSLNGPNMNPTYVYKYIYFYIYDSLLFLSAKFMFSIVFSYGNSPPYPPVLLKSYCFFFLTYIFFNTDIPASAGCF